MKEVSRIFAVPLKSRGRALEYHTAVLEAPTPERIAEVRRAHPGALDLTPRRIAVAVWRAVGRLDNHLHPV
jgi:hypothetical protein